MHKVYGSEVRSARERFAAIAADLRAGVYDSQPHAFAYMVRAIAADLTSIADRADADVSHAQRVSGRMVAADADRSAEPHNVGVRPSVLVSDVRRGSAFAECRTCGRRDHATNFDHAVASANAHALNPDRFPLAFATLR